MIKKVKKLVDVSLENKNEKLIALKDFKIVHNDFVKEIKKGDDLSDVPKAYIDNLKTEKVI